MFMPTVLTTLMQFNTDTWYQGSATISCRFDVLTQAMLSSLKLVHGTFAFKMTKPTTMGNFRLFTVIIQQN